MKITEFSKDNRFKFTDWHSVTNIVCLIITMLLVVIQIRKEFFKLTYSGIFDNISYSFISGYLFYLLMNYIPSRVRNKKARVILYQHFDIIWELIFACKKFSIKLESCYYGIQNESDDKTETFKIAYKSLSCINDIHVGVLEEINEAEKYISFMTLRQVILLKAIKRHYVFIVSEVAIKGGCINLFEEIFINYKELLDLADSLRKSAM